MQRDHFEISETDARDILLKSIKQMAKEQLLPLPDERDLQIKQEQPFPAHRTNISVVVTYQRTNDKGVEIIGTISPIGPKTSPYFLATCTIGPPRA